MGNTTNPYNLICDPCDRRFKWDRYLIEMPSHELEAVGEELEKLWSDYAKTARTDKNPEIRSVYGNSASAMVHFAILLSLRFPGFSDCVPLFRDRGLLK